MSKVKLLALTLVLTSLAIFGLSVGETAASGSGCTYYGGGWCFAGPGGSCCTTSHTRLVCQCAYAGYQCQWTYGGTC